MVIAPPSVARRILFAAFFLCFTGCNTRVISEGLHGDAAGHAESLLRDVGSEWSVATLDHDVMPGYYNNSSRANEERLFAVIRRKLGRLDSLKTLDSTRRVAAGASGIYGEARFEYEATFQKGNGRIELTIIERGDGWKIERLSVNSNSTIE